MHQDCLTSVEWKRHLPFMTSWNPHPPRLRMARTNGSYCQIHHCHIDESKATWLATYIATCAKQVLGFGQHYSIPLN